MNERNQGRFVKGRSYRFTIPKLYWERDWLYNEYVEEKKSAKRIAIEQGCNENNILYFLKKHNIETRTMSEIRRIKHWGARGKNNPMFGRYGKLNPNWNGGNSPERQSKYARYYWKELAKSILKRDNYKCRKCGQGHIKDHKLIVHHIKPWARYPELRFVADNLITLCEACHKNEHRGV